MEITLERTNLAGEEDEQGARAVELQTSDGVIHGRLHPAETGNFGVVWVTGSDTRMGNFCLGLANQLKNEAISSLRIVCRNPGDLVSSVLDLFIATYFLGTAGCNRVILVGELSSSAAVMCAAAEDAAVVGVAALSGEKVAPIEDVAGKPILLMDGADDVERDLAPWIRNTFAAAPVG
jgi:hypothetical protein